MIDFEIVSRLSDRKALREPYIQRMEIPAHPPTSLNAQAFNHTSMHKVNKSRPKGVALRAHTEQFMVHARRRHDLKTVGV
jgi:hypothetical protein